jgi:CRP/FNR family transcriptional regulator, cyclic AMP receptor protein
MTMDTAAAIEETFAAVPLLARLSRRQRARLAAVATTRAYPAEAVIVRQGDTSMSFYVVLSGCVRVERREADNGRVVARTLERAGSFGEMGLIDDLPRSATVVAVEPTECALLAKWDFANELREDPDIALALLPVLTGRIRELESRLERHGVEQARVRT